MDFITRLADSVYFAPRYRRIERYVTHAEEIQQEVMRRLVSKATDTEWGKKFNYKTIKDYSQFASRLPIQTYEEVKTWVERARQSEKNVLWPGSTVWFAKSSGTTNDKSKFIPVTSDSIQDTHYRGGKDAVALYLHMNPKSHFSKGKSLVLGGSHAPNLNTNNSLVGDLSAILIENMPAMGMYLRVPSKHADMLRTPSQLHWVWLLPTRNTHQTTRRRWWPSSVTEP